MNRLTRLGAGLLLGGVLLLPAGVEAQAAGKAKWVGAGSAFSATYKKSNATTQTVLAGAAYQMQFQINGVYPYLPPHGTGTAFGPTVDIYCVDFLHTAKTGTYDAYFTNLGLDPLVKTRTADKSKYMQVAWLAQQMESVLFPLTDQEKNERAAIHGAMWQIMAGQPVAVQTTNYAMSGTRLNYWVTQSLANYTSVRASDWAVVTDKCVSTSGSAGKGSSWADGCGQEFLTRTVTPEPETIVLLATGILVVLGMAGAIAPPKLA